MTRSAVAGSSIPLAAQLAAEEINAKGGINGRKIEIVAYDDHSSSADAVRAFQRAVSEDKVNAFLPTLDGMMTSGLVTMEKVQVLQYGAKAQ